MSGALAVELVLILGALTRIAMQRINAADVDDATKARIRADHEATLAETRRLTPIPAPPS